MLRGEYVILRVPESDDLDIMTSWQNDREVARFLPQLCPISKKYIESVLKESRLDKSQISFIIETEDEIPIDICSFKNIDWINGNGNISVIIYAKNCWGRGYGYDTLETLTNYGLFELNLFTLYAHIIEDNERAIKCFQKSGYEKEGILYNRLFMNGSYKNIISMSISKARM